MRRGGGGGDGLACVGSCVMTGRQGSLSIYLSSNISLHKIQHMCCVILHMTVVI